MGSRVNGSGDHLFGTGGHNGRRETQERGWQILNWICLGFNLGRFYSNTYFEELFQCVHMSFVVFFCTWFCGSQCRICVEVRVIGHAGFSVVRLELAAAMEMFSFSSSTGYVFHASLSANPEHVARLCGTSSL